MSPASDSRHRLRSTIGPGSSTWRLKKLLLLLILIGGISYVTSTGTFALMNSQESNHAATAATGTLTFNNTVNAGTTCYSWASASSYNENVVTLGTLAPSLGTSGAITALPVAALTTAVNSSDSITVTSGSNTQTFTASASAAVGATSLTITSATPNYAYPTGSTVTDTTSGGSTTLEPPLGTSSAITSLPVSDLSGAVSSGDSITVSSGTNSQTFTVASSPTTPAAAIGATAISINSATPTYAFPAGSIVSDATHGGCETLSGLSSAAAITALPVAALTATVSSGDSITVTSGSHTQTLTASASASSGATAIPVTSATPSFPFPLGSTVQDTTHSQTTTLGPALYYPGQTETSELTISDDGSAPIGDLQVFMPTCVQATTPGAPAVANPTNPCSSGTEFYIEQVNSSGTALTCWYPTDLSGACTPSDVTSTTTSALSTTGAITSLPVSALSGEIYSGDTVTVSSATLSTTQAITKLPVATLPAKVSSGDSITVTSGAHNQTFTASAAASAGATSISITSATPAFAFPTGASVQDTTHTGAVTTLGSFTQNYTVTANALTSATSVAVSSRTPNYSYPSGASVADTTYSGSLGTFAQNYDIIQSTLDLGAGPSVGALATSAAITSLPVSGLSTAVSSGDSITVSSGGHNQTFTASGNAIVGATAIPVTSATPNYAYPTGSTVSDTTHAGSTTLTPSSRYFIIGMRLPTNASNSLQGQMADFTLDWYVSS